MISDAIENIVDGLLHLEGDGVAVKPDLDEEETLVEVKDEREVGRNTCLVRLLCYLSRWVSYVPRVLWSEGPIFRVFSKNGGI